MAKKKSKTLDYKPITDFLRGKASIIFREVADNDSVVIVNRNSKPQNVIISYERYKRMIDNDKVELLQTEDKNNG